MSTAKGDSLSNNFSTDILFPFPLSIRHEVPTALTPSTTLSVPFPPFSPLPHLVRLCFSPSFYALSVRYLAEQESPTHPNFIADPNAVQRANALMDKCADLMSSLCVVFI